MTCYRVCLTRIARSPTVFCSIDLIRRQRHKKVPLRGLSTEQMNADVLSAFQLLLSVRRRNTSQIREGVAAGEAAGPPHI